METTGHMGPRPVFVDEVALGPSHMHSGFREGKGGTGFHHELVPEEEAAPLSPLRMQGKDKGEAQW